MPDVNTISHAETLAKRDATLTNEQIANLKRHDPEAERYNGRFLLCDGSQYSPSWRALTGGSELWQITSDMSGQGELSLDMAEAYEEMLDKLMGEIGAYWEEGCLFLDTEGYLHEEDCG